MGLCSPYQHPKSQGRTCLVRQPPASSIPTTAIVSPEPRVSWLARTTHTPPPLPWLTRSSFSCHHLRISASQPPPHWLWGLSWHPSLMEARSQRDARVARIWHFFLQWLWIGLPPSTVWDGTRMQVWSVASLHGLKSGIAVSCGVGRRRGLDPALLWLWCRLAAVALIRPLAWELPYAKSVALKSKKRKKEREFPKHKIAFQCWTAKTVFKGKCPLKWSLMISPWWAWFFNPCIKNSTSTCREVLSTIYVPCYNSLQGGAGSLGAKMEGWSKY